MLPYDKLQCDCPIDFDYCDMLASDTNSFRLLIKESLLINRDKPVLKSSVLWGDLTHTFFDSLFIFLIKTNFEPFDNFIINLSALERLKNTLTHFKLFDNFTIT